MPSDWKVEVGSRVEEVQHLRTRHQDQTQMQECDLSWLGNDREVLALFDHRPGHHLAGLKSCQWQARGFVFV